MIERLRCPLVGPEDLLASSAVRYDLLHRLSRAATRREVGLLAFGMGADELRMVLEGPGDEVTNTLRGLKTGSVHKLRKTWGAEIGWGPGQREVVHPLALSWAVSWAHLAPVEAGAASPLASPWSSHRDLLGFRQAAFYDPAVLGDRVDPERVHALAGGRPLPQHFGRRRRCRSRESLVLLMRLSGAILGVLPNDPTAHCLFAHLAQARGWERPELARALAVSARWVRHLLAKPEPRLGTALVCLGDPRLCRVP